MTTMRSGEFGMRNAASAAVGVLLVVTVVWAEEKSQDYKTETIRGHVVFLSEAVQQQTGVAAVPEARERVLAVQTKDGTLVPLLEDVRARAFSP